MSHATDRDLLELDSETMRRTGYQVVDMLIDWLAAAPTGPVIRRVSPGQMRERLSGSPPAQGEDFDAILGQIGRDVLPYIGWCAHPSYLAFIPGSSTWPAALADFIVSACNLHSTSWMESAGPSQLELVVLDWFKAWIGYPPSAGGILVSGGSQANMTALACAREALLGAMSDRVVAYVSDQAHSSMARAARILGFRPDQVRVLPVDPSFRMRPDALQAAMEADLAAGRQPLFVSAAAGSTSTGAVDTLPELAGICRERGVWFHVDAAYGGFVVLTERGKHVLAGIELANSVTLDPHKWLYQPFECGCLLVREGNRLREAFEIIPDYLKDTEVGEQEVNFSDFGIQLTRACRALKVWLSFKYFGLDAFRATIDRCLDLANLAQERIQRSAQLELLHPAALGVVCFRRRFAGVDDEDEIARLNAGLIEALTQSGKALISSTRLRGRYALRLCVLNHASTAEDVEGLLDWIERAPVPPLAAQTQRASYNRQPGLDRSWLQRRPVSLSRLREIPLFRSLTDPELGLVAHSAYEKEIAAGEAVVRQWEVSNEFYVVLDGAAQVRAGEEHRDDIGPGDFFGELAALEWGASFGYPRLASVVAMSDMRLLVLPGATFRTLVRDVPGFGDEIQRTVRQRLPGL